MRVGKALDRHARRGGRRAARRHRGARRDRADRDLDDLHASAAYRRRVAVTLARARHRRCLQSRREPRRACALNLTVNGATHAVEVEPRTTLLDCLRDDLLLTGAHAGCEHGVCGACTVLIDGAPVRSCLMFAVQADGYAITTIEGRDARAGRAVAGAGRVLRDARHAVRLLHAGDDPHRARAARRTTRRRPATRSSRRSPATSAAAPATRRSSKRSRSPPSACAA